jgi:hypothetical protein
MQTRARLIVGLALFRRLFAGERGLSSASRSHASEIAAQGFQRVAFTGNFLLGAQPEASEDRHEWVTPRCRLQQKRGRDDGRQR